jgi:iron complex outermembrane receptor protein
VLLVVVSPVLADEEGGDYESDEVDLDVFVELDVEDEFAFLEEDDIVFTAAKHEQDIAEAPSAITVITREQLENTHCTDVICLLRQVPEVDVRRVLPLFTSVGARALTGELGDKALVLIDGREINVEVFGMPFWQGMPVHLQDIERIEVIRGPGSALYGANAHSAVISIFTRKDKEGLAEVFVGGGERNRLSYHMRLNRSFGDWHLHVAGGGDLADNWRLREKTERDLQRVRLRLMRETEESSTAFHLGLVVADGLIYGGPILADGEDMMVGHFLASPSAGWIKAQISVGIYTTDFTFDAPLYFGEMKLGEWPDPIDVFTSNADAEVQLTWRPFEGNLLIGGGNYRWITFISDDNYPEVVNQHRVGVFVHDEQRLGESLILTAGLRFDYNNITPYSFSPRAACVWRFVEDQFLRVAFGRAFRKPSFFNTSMHPKGVKGEPGFEELEDFFKNNIGNEHVENESITAFELGYFGRFLDRKLVLEGDVFFNMFRNSINFHIDMQTNDLGMPSLTDSQVRFSNAGRDVNAVGGSISATLQFGQAWHASANYTYRYSWYISQPESWSSGEGGKGDRVSWEPEHLLNLSIRYVPESGPRFGLALHGQSANDVGMPENGLIFDDFIVVHSPATLFISGFAAWRVPVAAGWVEAGIRAFDLAHVGFRDTQAVNRSDGSELGGEFLGRRLFLFLRGSI